MATETTIFIPRMGTTANLANFTGATNEMVIDTTKHVWVGCDGNKLGGYPMAREDLDNVDVNVIKQKGIADTKLSNVNIDDIKQKGIALSDGTNINLEELFNRGVAQKTGENLQKASTVKEGIARFATVTEVVNGNDVDLMISPYTLKTYMTATSRVFSPMYISGLDPVYVDGSTVSITVGSCRTADDSMNLLINSPIMFTLGSRAPNSTYHAFVGANDKGQTIAQLFTTITPQAMIDMGYTHYRRLASIQTDESGNIIRFVKLQDTIYYENALTFTTPTSTYTEINTPGPRDIWITPIIEVIPNGSYSIGISGLSETSAIDFKSQGVCNCFVSKNTMKQKGSGTAQLIGYVDTRQNS